MNPVWLKYLFTILSAVPSVVSGVETIVTGAKQGATKKDLAMASLGLATGTAETVAPEFAPMIEGASALASVAIDSTVAFANLVNKGGAKPAPASPPVIIIDPAPTPAPTLQVTAQGTPATVTSVPDATGDSSGAGPGLHTAVSA